MPLLQILHIQSACYDWGNSVSDLLSTCLGLSCYSIQCTKWCLETAQKVPDFLDKIKTKTQIQSWDTVSSIWMSLTYVENCSNFTWILNEISLLKWLVMIIKIFISLDERIYFAITSVSLSWTYFVNVLTRACGQMFPNRSSHGGCLPAM